MCFVLDFYCCVCKIMGTDRVEMCLLGLILGG